jgi:hypothetical protein
MKNVHRRHRDAEKKKDEPRRKGGAKEERKSSMLSSACVFARDTFHFSVSPRLL